MTSARSVDAEGEDRGLAPAAVEYRPVQHIAALYRVPATTIENAAYVLEEIDAALSQVPS